MNRNLNILQIASVGLPVTPQLKYGGTERVISYLDETFSKMGHNSYVAATGDSVVKGTLIPTISKSQWCIDGTVSITRSIIRKDEIINEHYQKCIDYLIKNPDIDIAHDHPGSGLVTTERFKKAQPNLKIPILVTLHGAVSGKYHERYAKWAKISQKGSGVYFNAISESQRNEFEKVGIRVEDVVYHGIPMGRFVPSQEKKSDFLFTIGRIAPEKGQDLAIEVAKRSHRKLVIAGEVHSINENYWKEKVEPFVDGDQVKFVGPLTDEEKIPYFQDASALIFPLQWKEPFGLVLIESMGCGTPVISFDRGSIPEIVEDGKTGFVIHETGDKQKDLEQMVYAVNNLNSIDSNVCRSHVENSFSIETEAQNYLNLYDRLMNS